MVQDTTNKKTLWGRFKSWLAGTWPGRAWSKVLNTVKGWFSSNGATKAGGGQPEANISTKDGKAPDGKVLSHEQSLGNSEVPASVTPATEEPAKPTPNNGTSATPLSEHGKESFNMGRDNPTPSTQPLSPEVEKLSGKITVYTDGKKEVALELNVGKHFDTLKKWENPATSEEFCVFIKLSDKILYITGRYDSKREASGDVVTINSVRIHGTETVYDVNNLKEMKNLVGLNKTTEIDVEISNVPFEVPEVKSPKTPEKTTNVDTGSPQGSPQPQGDSKGENVTVGPKVAPESPELKVESPISPVTEKQLQPEGETEVAEPAPAPTPTSLVTEGSPQSQGGTGTAETESKVESLEGQDNGQQLKEDEAFLSDGEEKKEHTEGGPEATPSEPAPAKPALANAEEKTDQELHLKEVEKTEATPSEPAPAEAPFTETVAPGLQQLTGKTKDSRK